MYIKTQNQQMIDCNNCKITDVVDNSTNINKCEDLDELQLYYKNFAEESRIKFKAKRKATTSSDDGFALFVFIMSIVIILGILTVILK